MNQVSLEFRIAESRLQHLESEMDAVIAAHHEAHECHECEQKIKFSIDVYRCIHRAEEAAIIADQDGIEEFTAEQNRSIKLAYERWLV